MYSLLKPLLFWLDPETAHTAVKWSGKIIPLTLLSSLTRFESSRLSCQIGATVLKNPIGLAAGFDKNGDMIDFMGGLGFGFVEIGSVTAHPCQGNPKPRLFRLPQDQSLVNRLGLPNSGSTAVAKKLFHRSCQTPFGINIAQTPDFALSHPKKEKSSGIDDYLETFAKLHAYGAYLVLNLSCPNTSEGCAFEQPKVFSDLARQVAATRKTLGVTKPVLIKLSPDLKLPDLRKTVEISLAQGFDGFVLTNTTSSRVGVRLRSHQIDQIGPGGLSGKGLADLSNQQIQKVCEMIDDKQMIVGCGGIMSATDLMTKLALGARYFQIYTGLVYQGPFFIKGLLTELDAFCQKRGVKNYQELVGNKELAREIGTL